MSDYNKNPAAKNAANDFITFLNKSVTPFHAVASCEEILKDAGFIEVMEDEKFSFKPSEKYYMTKNGSTIFAFAVGGAYRPESGGFSMIAAHTDSPCLRVKPVSKRNSEKFLQVGVSCYGGGLWRTWFDRDLSVAGQVVLSHDGKICHRLIDLIAPILNIPSLAIHLDPVRDKFEFNTEEHLRPIFAHSSSGNSTDQTKDQGEKNCCVIGDHHEDFLKKIAEHAKCKPKKILDMDLCLYDAQPAMITGLNEEFISGARLDNLVGTYTSIMGLVNSLKNNELLFKNDPNIRFVACFDNEEVGNTSAQGAASHITEWLLRRLTSCERDHAHQACADPTAFERAIARSFLISADQAHSAHPNYSSNYEDNHKPYFKGGVVVKSDYQLRYTCTAITHSVVKVIADSANVPLQKLLVRNDSTCGWTIGRVLAANLGIQTIDLGCPQLAMHSIRELGDAASIHQAITLYSKYFEQLPYVLQTLGKHNV